MKFTKSQLEQSVISLLDKQGILHTSAINFVKVPNFDKVFQKGSGTEPETNENNALLLWDYERIWVERDEMRDEESPMVQEYIQDVLPLWKEDHGIPLSLKALLYNRCTH